MDFNETLIRLNERVLNLFTPEQKKPYVDEVWDMLQKSYAYAGGIKGSGFSSKKDMLNNIPFWKLIKKDGKIVAVRFYKDKNGRKAVASATDESYTGKKEYKRLTKADLDRSYFEISDKALASLKRQLGDEFWKYAIPVSQVKKKLTDDEIIPVDEYHYQRKIGGELITKVMVGNINAKPIY